MHLLDLTIWRAPHSSPEHSEMVHKREPLSFLPEFYPRRNHLISCYSFTDLITSSLCMTNPSRCPTPRSTKEQILPFPIELCITYELGIALAFPPAEPDPSLAPPFCANQSRNWNMLAFGYRSSDVWLRYCNPNLTWLPENHSKLS